LTNAIYFKGDWVSPFQKQQTRGEEFHIAADRNVSVPMMHQTKEFNYLEGEDFQALEMPYAGDALGLVAFLPRKEDGLATFEQVLTADKLAGWLNKLHKQEVQVTFPRFRTTTEFQLKDTLSEMGMALAFNPDKADLSGISEEEKLFLSAVVHKAYVDVYEEGTEAAAATGIAVGKAALVATPVFRADHPFVFLIRDRRTGSILFLGRLSDPRA
jgi:serpin B